jgi:hypothetical protein
MPDIFAFLTNSGGGLNTRSSCFSDSMSAMAVSALKNICCEVNSIRLLGPYMYLSARLPDEIPVFMMPEKETKALSAY